jgi:hypothetical protein
MAKNRIALFLTIFTVFFAISLVVAKPVSAGWLQNLFGAEEASEKIDESNKAAVEGNVSVGAVTTEVVSSSLGVSLRILGGSSDGTEVGAINDVSRLIGSIYKHKPADTGKYVAMTLEEMKIVPPAYAQGLGFASLDPILESWKTFRNLAYFFFVIIFLVIGFMIMFRHKISGQTVVTAQQAIPNIIIALVFVTFSYAIAGLMIDLMYLLMYLLIGLFGRDYDLINKNIFGLGVEMVNLEVGGSVADAVNAFVTASLSGLGGLGDALGWVSGITVAVIISVAILLGVFKLFFELLKTYITIILLIAFSPIILMMGALPGKNVFMSWIKDLAMNLMVFPVVLIVLIVYKMMSATKIGAANEGGGFMPPYLLGQGSSEGIMAIVGVGILLIVTDIVKKIKPKSGVFEEFAQGMFKQAQAGEIALPVAGATVRGGAGLAAIAPKLGFKKEKINPFSQEGRRVMREGYTTKRDGEEVNVGGLHQARKGWEWGTGARKKIDAIQEGRFFEASDTEKLLERIAGQKTPEEKTPDTTPQIGN